MRQLTLFAALLATAVYALPTVKYDWNQINVLDGSPEGSTYVYPHAAAFSDGRYVVVYPVQTVDASSRVVGQIFYPNGSVAVSEFEVEPDATTYYTYSAPRVVVFADDTFMVAYRFDSGDPTSIQARRFSSDGTALDLSFRIDQGGVSVTTQGIELIAYADYSYSVLYYNGGDGCTQAAVYDTSDNLVVNHCIFAPSAVVGLSPFAVLNRARTVAYVGSNTDNTDIAIGSLTEAGVGNFATVGPVEANEPAIDIAVSLSGDRALTMLYTLNGNITYATVNTDTLGGFRTGLIAIPNADSAASSPAIISLNDTTVLMAFKFQNNTENTEYLLYQTGAIIDLESSFDLEPTNTVLPFSTKLHAFHFTPLTGSDILVVAKDPETYRIKQQIITFCGNGRLELDEECDGSAYCDSSCRCTDGLVGYQGECGLPNVIPVLDCVQPVQEGNTLYFSFINQDRVVHTIDQGEANAFSPVEYGGNRPTTFALGSSLTYPVSPYSVVLPTSEKHINWLLGSYNLTVDLTDVTPLLCPEAPGFIVSLALADFLDDGQILTSNFLNRYGVSLYRLTTSVVQTGGQVPAKKRVVLENNYDVTITIAPANETSTDPELSSAEAVRAVVVDYKNSTTQADVVSDLLNNYDPDRTAIKDITPAPTGVEVRGSRDNSPNIIPQAPQPTQPSSNPTPSTQSTVPQYVSSASVLASSTLCILALALLSVL